METIFSTDSVHPRDRFDYWHSVACKKIIGHDSVPENRLTFQAEMKTGKVGNLDLVEFSNSPLQVSHTFAHVDRTDPDMAFVCYQLSGSVLIVQNGREVNLDAGTLMLLEPLLPYEARFSAGAKMLLIKAPRRDLRARIGSNRELTARRVTAERLDDSLALSLAAKLPDLAGRTTSITEEIVANHVLDLIGLSIGRTLGNAPGRVSNPKALLLAHIRSVVETRLSEPDLDGQKVADIVGITFRYANALLAEQDTSLNRLILSRRLSRCRFALEDPNQPHRTIAEIAHGWGFSDMTHFGRCFKAAYGASPRDYQKAAQSGQAGRP
ncbi:helix-turn-helix domain-containing protein [Bradyrhizobium manausense]|uniref:AraC family transcriptional regulator n=1 Tax=Bradyrhizobium manausense TaxID=989370 RepID=A0A0R3D1E0_9BRAD|nr:helix-turn-helix domain-containing protein [Bradyrhizobium manausense]KRQ02381.1 AraC family transcriptional regulator [Bradyrhizobium manausense]